MTVLSHRSAPYEPPALKGTGITLARASELAQGAPPATPFEHASAPALRHGWTMSTWAEANQRTYTAALAQAHLQYGSAADKLVKDREADPTKARRPSSRALIEWPAYPPSTDTAIHGKPGSGALYDLGQRLWAAHHGRPAPRLVMPVIHALDPEPRPEFEGQMLTATAYVARQKGEWRIRIDRPGHEPQYVTVHARDSGWLLSTLAEPEVPMRLVIPNQGTLDQLHSVMLGFRAGALAGTAAARACHLIAWWVDRADHPAAGAVINLTSALSQRWLLPSPLDERDIAKWATALGVTPVGRSPIEAMADLHERVAGLPPELPGKDGDADTATFQRIGTYEEWRWPDTPRAAVVGWRAREASVDDLAERLSRDPLWMERSRWTGDVSVGCVIDASVREDGEVTRTEIRIAVGDAPMRQKPGQLVSVVGPSKDGEWGFKRSGVIAALSYEPGRGTILVVHELDKLWVRRLGELADSGAAPLVQVAKKQYVTGEASARAKAYKATKDESWVGRPRGADQVGPRKVRRQLPVQAIVFLAPDAA